MALSLPHSISRKPVEVEAEGVQGHRRVSFRVELLDQYEHLIKELEGVAPDGSLEWSASSSVKGTGKIEITDTDQDIDFLNDRVRISIITEDDYRDEEETPLGVFLMAAPTAEWKDGVRSWSVELSDKTSILDVDTMYTGSIISSSSSSSSSSSEDDGVIEGPEEDEGSSSSHSSGKSGMPKSFSVEKDDNVIQMVKAIIADSGEESPAISTADSKVKKDMVWDVKDSRLKIINDLLDSANYRSLWCDGKGRFRATKYKKPSRRKPLYRMIKPFTDGDESLMKNEWSHDEDIYDVPNRLIAIENGTGDDEGDVAVAENRDKKSKFSYDNRERWITQVEDGVNISDDESLEDWAERKLHSAMEVTSKLKISHLYLPDVMVNEVVKVDAGEVKDSLCKIEKTEISLDPEDLVETELNEVADDG